MDVPELDSDWTGGAANDGTHHDHLKTRDWGHPPDIPLQLTDSDWTCNVDPAAAPCSTVD